MTNDEALALCRAARGSKSGGRFYVYADVAAALGATAGADRPNKNFAATDKTIDGDPVFVFHRPGVNVHYGPKLPQEDAPRERDAHLHDPHKGSDGRPKKPIVLRTKGKP